MASNFCSRTTSGMLKSKNTHAFTVVRHMATSTGYETGGRAVKKQDFYTLLGVTPNSTQKDIKSAYRKLVLVNHPDVNKEEGAHAKISLINEAYSTLSSYELRRRYDKSKGYVSSTQKTKDYKQFHYKFDHKMHQRMHYHENIKRRNRNHDGDDGTYIPTAPVNVPLFILLAGGFSFTFLNMASHFS